MNMNPQDPTPEQREALSHLHDTTVHVAQVVTLLLQHEYDKHLQETVNEAGLDGLAVASTYSFAALHLAMDAVRAAVKDLIGSEQALVFEAEVLEYVRYIRSGAGD